MKNLDKKNKINKTSNTGKIVFVSGCFDMLHSGHVAFFEEAATHGDLYVGLGSDKTVFNLKGRKTVFNEDERLYMVKSIRFVHGAMINTGSGLIDFNNELIKLQPDILFVNEDGHTSEKEKICAKYGIDYVVSKRIPHEKLPSRSTTSLRKECRIPYRIDLAGGWLDQPFVSKHYPGSVITISIEPEFEFNDRSGMSTSTRRKAIDLWQNDVPQTDREQNAKILFSYENPPGNHYVSGSQDAIGIVMPGMNKIDYQSGEYWPVKIHNKLDPEIITWLEDHIRLIALKPRGEEFDVLNDTDINTKKAKDLAGAADILWYAALNRDEGSFGKAMTDSFNAQVAMFPNMIIPEVLEGIEQIRKNAFGWKLSGAGGGGYLVVFIKNEIPNSMKIKIRREE